ncbi:MAG: hypothetical protein IKJ63_11610 [Clostridia bacterium]|nr:hypothetical protein [Clostridia bacterium]
MSKKQYVATFSDLHPADEALERIMTMKERKQNIAWRKTLIVAAVAISVLFALGAVAYAATDGEIANTVVETFDLVAGKVYILVNGEQTMAELDISEQVNEDGEPVYYVQAGVPLSDTDTEIRMEYIGEVEDISTFELYIQEAVETTMEATQSE